MCPKLDLTLVSQVKTFVSSVSTALCVQDKMLSMAVANHVLWPLAKFVNAKLVPKQHQPVANKVVQVTLLPFTNAANLAEPKRGQTFGG